MGGFSHLLFNYTKVIITVMSKVQHKSASYSRFIDFVLAFGKKDVLIFNKYKKAKKPINLAVEHVIV
jgi:hypothetical protein